MMGKKIFTLYAQLFALTNVKKNSESPQMDTLADIENSRMWHIKTVCADCLDTNYLRTCADPERVGVRGFESPL